MAVYTYDIEVFAYDWLVEFKEKETGVRTKIWNDNESVAQMINSDSLYFGFNSKHYDQYIIKGICSNMEPVEIKELNDYLISGFQGWQYPAFNDYYFKFNNVDLRDDMQMGLSLKAIEGHLGMSIRESSVPFDIDRPLTLKERKEVEMYCDHDVDTTESLIGLRNDYLKNKIKVGSLAGLSDVDSLSKTNAKLTAAMLGASKAPHDDERKYIYPDNLQTQYIPSEILDYFNRMYDESLSDDEVFKQKLETSIGECPVTIGYGGIHGAIPHYVWKEEAGGIMRNYDVGSYYPHLMTLYGYTSRNIPSPDVFEGVLDNRMQAKASGDKATADAMKLVVNTTYGASLNQYNDLYDPLMGRSVCITGQLFLFELANHLYQDIPGLKVVQLNTDGVMIEFDDSHYGKVQDILNEWQERTRFELEEDSVKLIAQKDVNNYVEVQTDGTVKKKGGYLVRGIAQAGAWNINNNAVIVADAITEYFVSGIPAEDTINTCDDPFKFQMIAKAGAKYREAYHMIDGEKHPVQKVNRVYATSDERYGKVYKVKASDDSEAKIESLPEHCIIDNDNEISIEDIDKSFYVNMAKKRINDFLGIVPEKKKKERSKNMAAKKETKEPVDMSTKNVFQKLLYARAKFLENGVSKSGKHMELRYKYFELDDIVPIAIGIFAEAGLIPLVRFTEDTAIMDVVNTDVPEEVITFSCPMRYPSENKMVNPVQALGSAQTYLRRYLYMIALDICEPDSIEPTTEAEPKKSVKTSATAKKTPATEQERKEIKEKLTAPAEKATDLQIKGLKKVLKKLKDAQPDKEEMIAKIAVETNGFTDISKSDCEAMIERITAMLEESEGEDAE